MGFMGISIVESDMASDFCSDVVEGIKKKCIKELKNKANAYNTPGYINVSLILKSVISEENEFHFTYDWEDIWEKLTNFFNENDADYNNKEANKQYKDLKKWVLEMNEKCKQLN